MNTKTVLTVNEQCGSAASVAQTSKSSSIGRNRREARRFFVYSSQVAKRLECVQLAGAVGSAWGVGKREQAPRTPNASRDLVAVPPRCANRDNYRVNRGLVRSDPRKRSTNLQNHSRCPQNCCWGQSTILPGDRINCQQ